ncbi:hypothetical protein FFL01_22070 [Flavobacterium flevense]|uniref:Lipoprotein n=1 Tax=Flavobacterium flevense TaxID=983 RepID=A0A4Y4AWR8_9FLAO|nr:hypothetical protein [Flavobacterium flevense]GEC72668.1 hypothetical protein FFL01_22070 [Flavobacterium flevense]
MKRIIFLIVIIALVSCKKEKTKSSTSSVTEGIPIARSVSKIIKQRDFSIKNFSRIELISYYDRISWDTIKYKGEQPINKILVDDFKLTFDSTMVQERVVLNKTQEKELINLIVCDTCIPEEISSACYMPRHMIIFRDSKDRIIGYNEFCLNCAGSRISPNLDGFQKYCYSDMGELFKKFGIKLFVEDDQLGKEYSIIDSLKRSKKKLK